METTLPYAYQQNSAALSKTMSAAVLHITESTLGFPNVYDKGVTEVTLWNPEIILHQDFSVYPGAAAWMSDPNAYHKILAMVMEAGMHWEEGPYRAAVLAHIDEMEEWEEHGTAYEQWCQQDTNMDDLHEPSLFTEWNQAESGICWVGGGYLGVADPSNVPKYTPEMLQQRDMLNYFYNFKWNTCDRFTIARYVQNSIVPDQTELLELVAVGDNHGVAKCLFGAVYVPKSALKHLQYNGGCEIGTIFDGEITFTPENKFPWRLKHNGIIYTY